MTTNKSISSKDTYKLYDLEFSLELPAAYLVLTNHEDCPLVLINQLSHKNNDEDIT